MPVRFNPTHLLTKPNTPPNDTEQNPQVGTYVDKKCPFTGNVSIRGRILKGIVVSTKMTRTLIIRRDYLHWISKYKRCVRAGMRALVRLDG